MKHVAQLTIVLLLLIGFANTTSAQRKTVELRITQNYNNGSVVVVDTTFLITRDSEIDELLEYLEERAPEVSTNQRYRPLARPQRAPAPQRLDRYERQTTTKDDGLILGFYPDDAFSGNGIKVRSIISGTAAEGAGLRNGDVITHVDGWEVDNTSELRKLLNHFKMGEAIVIEYERRGQTYSGMGRLTESQPEVQTQTNSPRFYVAPEPREPRIAVAPREPRTARVPRTANNSGEKRVMLGVYPENVSSSRASKLDFPDTRGVYISGVTSNGAAEQGGIRKGDIVTRIDDEWVDNTTDLHNVLKAYDPGDYAEISFWRDGRKRTAEVRLKPKGGTSSSSNITTNKKRVMLGVYPENISRSRAENLDFPDTRGVYISGVTSGGGAQEAGVRKGDIITRIDGEWIDNTTDLRRVLSEYAPGERVSLSVWRDGRRRTIESVLRDNNGKLPSSSSTYFNRDSRSNTTRIVIPDDNDRNQRIIISPDNGQRIFIPRDRDDFDRDRDDRLDDRDDRNSGRPYLGVYLNTSRNRGGGVAITGLVNNGAAEDAGLRKGDVIMYVDRYDIDDYDELVSTLKKFHPGDRVEIGYTRDGRKRETSVRLRRK